MLYSAFFKDQVVYKIHLYASTLLFFFCFWETKKMRFLMVLVFTFVPITYSNLIAIDNSDTLEYYLCNNGLNSDTALVLSSAEYVFSKDMFCVVQSVSNVIITSNSSAGSANLTCNGNFQGFGFFNASNLTLSHLTFIRCGGEISLPNNVAQFTNGSNLFILPHQMCVLLISHCSNTTLNFVSIEGPYHGFGIFLVNALENSTLQDIDIRGEWRNASSIGIRRKCPNVCYGSGIVFVYMNSIHSQTVQSVYLVLNKIYISNCSNYYPFKDSFVEMFGPWNHAVPIVSGTGLTFLLGSNTHRVTIGVVNLSVIRSRASHAGSLLIVYHSTYLIHPILLSCLHFEYNSIALDQLSTSPVITFLFSSTNKHKDFPAAKIHTPISIYESKFLQNEGYKGTGILVISSALSNINTLIQIFNCSFIRNKAMVSGSAMHVQRSQVMSEGSYLKLFLSSISAYENSYLNVSYGVSVFSVILDQTEMRFETCNFSGNNGSVIEAYNSIIRISLSFLCVNNTSNMGSCFHLKGTSLLHFFKNTRANFSFNRALISGGAIYSDSLGSPNDICSIAPELESKITFEYNTALLDGYDIKMSNLYNCSFFFFDRIIHEKDNLMYYNKTLTFVNKTNRSMSSRVQELRSCRREHKRNLWELETYSGKTFHLLLKAIDSAKNPVHTSLTTFFYPDDNSKWTLEGVNYYNLYADKCNLLNFTIIASVQSESRGVFVIQSVEESSVSISLRVVIFPCPLGFGISIDYRDVCDCSHFLQKINANITCDIQNGLIWLPRSSWFGVVNKSVEVFSFRCPPNFCGSDLYQVDLKDALCKYNRTGIMCGQCSEGLSLVFGSDECQHCSNIWILSLIVYAMAGLILVLALFVIKITIAGGVLGSIVFFANVSAVCLHTEFLSDRLYTRPIKILMALFNLNLGFPLCFYNGMDSISKAALQFAFPLYLLSIVLSLVVMSRFSIRLTNLIVGLSVQMIATLIYFSFAKVLSAVSEILISSSIQMSSENLTHTVWYFDGSVMYLSPIHCTLFILSLVVIVLMILPYLIFTTTGSTLIAKNHCASLYLRPLIDAYHGPYKDKFRFWFGIRQWMLTLFYALYFIFRGSKPHVMLAIDTVILGAYIVIQVYIRPYKNRLLNIADVVFLMLLYISNIFTFYFLLTNDVATPSSSISIALFLLMYLCFSLVIVLLHVVMLFKNPRGILRAMYRHVTSRVIDEEVGQFNFMSREHFLETDRLLGIE